MIIMRPQNIWSLYKSVSSGVIDTVGGYLASYLTDGVTSNPFGADAVTGAATITGTAGMVDLIVLGNHNIWSPATVVLSGDVSQAFTIPAARPNFIQRNPFIKLSSPVSVDSLTITVTGAAQNFRIGELLAGLSEEWDLLEQDNQTTYDIFNIEHTPLDQPYDLGEERRGLKGSNWADNTERIFMEDWLAGTHGGTRPSVIIPNEADNDAWVVDLTTQIGNSQHRGDPDRLYKVSCTFREKKRHRF